MFLVSAQIPALGAKITLGHMSRREMTDDAASGQANEASEALIESFTDRARHHQGPLDQLMNTPSPLDRLHNDPDRA
jgi:hypothetical protein